MVRTAGPDGQTPLFMHTSLMIHAHTGRYPHPVSDFTPIAMAQIYPSQVYAVGADAPWNTLSDFVEDARANPGKLTVAPSFRIGCIGQLGASEMQGALKAITDVMKEMGVESGKS